MLTFERGEGGSIEIYMDDAGQTFLSSIVSRIKNDGDHEHLMTVAWGAGELDETVHNTGNTIVDMVTIGKVPS